MLSRTQSTVTVNKPVILVSRLDGKGKRIAFNKKNQAILQMINNGLSYNQIISSLCVVMSQDVATKHVNQIFMFLQGKVS